MRSTSNQTPEGRQDENEYYRPQRKIILGRESEETQDNYIRPTLPHHGNRYDSDSQLNTRREASNLRNSAVSRPSVPGDDVNHIKTMALMREQQEELLYDADEGTNRHGTNQPQLMNIVDEEEPYNNTQGSSNYSTSVVSSNQNQYQREVPATRQIDHSGRECSVDRSSAPSPSLGYSSTASPTMMTQENIIQEEQEGQTVVAFPVLQTELEPQPKSKTEEGKKPRKSLWLLLSIIIVVLIVGIVVVATVALKGNDSKESSDTLDDSSGDPSTPKPTKDEESPSEDEPTVGPTTTIPTTSEPTTLPPTTIPPTFPPPAEPFWEQYGSDINGENAGDQFGYLIALSGDGSTVAGSSQYNDDGGIEAGSVRVFRFKGYTWKQIGQDIDGETGESMMDMPVAVSYNGATVAIGASTYDDNRTNVGRVYVLEYNENTDEWYKLGDSIYGLAAYDLFGTSVSLSGEGRTLAVGAMGADDGGVNSGHVRVFEYDDDMQSWEQIGQTIGGEDSGDVAGPPQGLKLSKDGKTIAIGSSENDGMGPDTGHVRVFYYDQFAYEWKQKGQDIEEANTGETGFGMVIDLSGEGEVVAIGAYGDDSYGGDSGIVAVYGFNSVGNKWDRLIGLYGNEGDECGTGVSLSYDGKTLAIGCYQFNNEKSGEVVVNHYNEESNDWSPLGPIIIGEQARDHFGVSVSLSDDGTVLAAGGHGNDGSGQSAGHVRVYKLAYN